MHKFGITEIAGLLLTEVVTVLALAANPPSYRIRLLTFCLVATIYVYCALWTTTGAGVGDYQLGSYYMCRTGQALDFLLLADAPIKFWPIKRPKLSERTTFWSRIKWATAFLFNPRAINWNYEPRHAHPPHPTDDTGRWAFVLRQAVRAFLAFVGADVGGAITRKNPSLYLGGSLTKDGLAMQALYSLGWYLSAGSGIVLMHAVIGGTAVAFGLTPPSEWPNILGGISEMYSVRKFWGKGWHQYLRRWLTSNANYIALHILRLPPKNKLTTYLEMYFAFFISGFVHFVGSYAMLRSIPGAFNTMLFFMLQPVVITMEDGVIALCKRFGFGDSPVARAVGYVWTAGWFVALTPIWLNTMVAAGLTDPGAGKSFSLVQGLLEGEWYPSGHD